MYKDEIKELSKIIPIELVDFSLPRDKARIPTQASSNFITNKEQGDWAENLLFKAINESSRSYVAVKYGKSDDLVAGEPGFDDFFEQFQEELDSIGKRPDILIFRKEDFQEERGYDISKIAQTELTDYVKKAVAGIEVRSSAFLIDRYERAMSERFELLLKKALGIKQLILDEYGDLLNHPRRAAYIAIVRNITKETVGVTDFRCPSWGASERLIQLKELFKKLKHCIKEIQKRDFLSITPKVEDIKVVYRWIETFNVPHYYFQVFFDKVYAISFKQILTIISNPDNEDVLFCVEEDSKNQNKTTIKIKSTAGMVVASKVEEPQHYSKRKEMERGRLLFYVAFKGGSACLDVDRLKTVLNLDMDF